jgi:hypothetical protein
VITLPTTAMGMMVTDKSPATAAAIVIRGGMSKGQTHETFLHEVLHVIEGQAIAKRIIPARFPEKVIEFFAGGLLVTLAGAGLYSLLAPKELWSYIHSATRPKPRAKRNRKHGQ